MSDSNKDLHIAILEYLQRLAKQPGSLDCDSVDIATQCLAESLGIDLFDKETKKKFLSEKNLTLEDVFLSGTSSSPSPNTAAAQSGAGVKATSGPKSLDDISKADLAAAEKFKNDGNSALSTNPSQAYEFYSKAIELNPFNHIYWNNRAVASYKDQDYEKAVADCKASIKIKPNYSKSHYRLGLSYTELGKYGDAITTLQKAKEVALEAQENAMVAEIDNSIKAAKRKQSPANTSNNAASNPMGGLDFGALASMMGGAGGAGGLDLGAIMQNPMFANMAQNIMGQMGGMEGLQSMMGGMNQQQVTEDDDDEDYDDEDDDGEVETQQQQQQQGGMPDLSGIDMNDPLIKKIMDEVKTNPMAAMQYLNNPEVMAKLGPVIQQMMGGMGGARR